MHLLNIVAVTLSLLVLSSSALSLKKVDTKNPLPFDQVDFLPCDSGPGTGAGVELYVASECQSPACPFDPSEQYDMSIVFVATETSNALHFQVVMYPEMHYPDTILADDAIPGFVIEGSRYNVSHVIEMADLSGANGWMEVQLWDESRGHSAACGRIYASFSGPPPTTTVGPTTAAPIITETPTPDAPTTTPTVQPITNDPSVPPTFVP